ncbi:doublesex and mab 3 transcription [Echinococcus multilocularis]|uniref:Doublesex and mab 3 transcription n=1 Tax=Echinococcus multilocularis TaxID=6211 RepID=A0A068YBA1_ECHMU|nr:doublesex and mab 3 transcription [Echinococcus multilocularis]
MLKRANYDAQRRDNATAASIKQTDAWSTIFSMCSRTHAHTRGQGHEGVGAGAGKGADAAALETNPTPRDWLNQSLKVEPGFTATARRVVCGSNSGNASAYFTSTTSAAHFEGGNDGGGVGEYAAFSLPRLGNSLPHQHFPCHHHAFGPLPPHPPLQPPPVAPLPPPAPPPSECSGTLTRAHAMHSLFESYTFESGTTRQHTSVRMDHHIVPPLPPPPPPSQQQSKTSGRCRKESVSSTEDSGKTTSEVDGGGGGGGGTGVVSRASYMCRKCKAHGQAVPVKRHKRACPYLQCRCLKCRLVDQGRKVVARQIALYRDQKGHSGGSSGSTNTTHSRGSRDEHSRPRLASLRPNPPLQLPLPRELRIDGARVLPSLMTPSVKVDGQALIGGRTVAGPHCRRCRNHNVAVTWKGHKKSCPYRNCPCDPCRLINVRKDTEKTLRDMAGIEEKSVLPTALLAEEATTTATATPMSNFFPYLMPVNNVPQPADIREPSSTAAEPASWNETVFPQHPTKRARSLQNLNAHLSVSEAQVNNATANQSEALEQTRVDSLEGARNAEQSGNSSNNSNNTVTTTNTTSNIVSSTFEQYHRSASYDAYYEEKASRPVLPFWQSFSHFEEKSTIPGQSYIGGYYGLENGRVFHGNSQGHHMYSPERVSAVAAAAAAAAAMVAMTPPINGAYQQPCYPPQGRPGGLCHPLTSQHSDHLGYTSSEDFNSPNTYQTRFQIERGRGDEYCGGSGGGIGGGGGGGVGGSNGGWGAYRYPYMVRGLPFHPGDPMEADFAFAGCQRHTKIGGSAMPKVVDESLYSGPVAHVWRSQLHQLSISQLRPEVAEEVKNFQQLDCDNKIECPNDVKRDAGKSETAVQSANQAITIRSAMDGNQRASAFREEIPSSNSSQPPPPPTQQQQQQRQQTEVIFEADPGSTSERGGPYQAFASTTSGSPFTIDDAQPHPFPAVGAET